MDLQLAGQAVIVTGGGSGIGAAITLALAEEGALPIVFGRDPLTADFEAALRQRQPLAQFHRVELTEPAASEAAVAAALDALVQAGRPRALFGLVHNAGVNDHVPLDPAEGGSRAAFLRSIDRNLTQVYTLTQACLPHLRAASAAAAARGALPGQGAAVVLIGSKTAVTGQGGTSGYVAAKAGLLGLTREWAIALRGDGIRVNTVLPAEVFTPMYRAELATLPDPEGTRRAIERRIPLGRRMTAPEEIAAMVVFLLSPRSGHTTGQWITVDGGYTHLDRAIGHEAD